MWLLNCQVYHMHMQATAEEDPDEQALIAQLQEKVRPPAITALLGLLLALCALSTCCHWVTGCF